MSAAEPEVWVVVCAYGSPANMLRPDGSRYPAIVMETDVDGATREAALLRAEQFGGAYGPCRIARLVFDNEPAAPAAN
jgi:hypothetical protein